MRTALSHLASLHSLSPPPRRRHSRATCIIVRPAPWRSPTIFLAASGMLTISSTNAGFGLPSSSSTGARFSAHLWTHVCICGAPAQSGRAPCCVRGMWWPYVDQGDGVTAISCIRSLRNLYRWKPQSFDLDGQCDIYKRRTPNWDRALSWRTGRLSCALPICSGLCVGRYRRDTATVATESLAAALNPRAK
jgi:hypothetical protein